MELSDVLHRLEVPLYDVLFVLYCIDLTFHQEEHACWQTVPLPQVRKEFVLETSSCPCTIKTLKRSVNVLHSFVKAQVVRQKLKMLLLSEIKAK